MKRSRRPTFVRALALMALVLGGVWFGIRKSELSPERQQGASGVGPAVVRVPEVANRPMRTTTATGAQSEAPPPARFAFDALTQGRVPLRTEARMFQAQKWEPDIAKALDLPPGTPLQRRSAIYRIPELKFPLVLVDRIYRMDRPKGGANGAVAPSQTASEPLAPPSTTKAPGPVAPPSASASEPAGELLWDNAMIADHLMVQAQPGVSREQLQRALPSSCHIQSAVNAEKGLFLVSIPHESERSLGLAVLALNHESLKKTIWFAEPDFLMSGADTTPNDSLFTTSTTDVTKQWHLPRIRSPLGWDVVRQPAAVGALSAGAIASLSVVAVVDTGVDYTHPDLSPNIWNNPGETGAGKETNGLDDDGNGKIDDWRGWNFVENNNDPMDDVSHGTHVAGIIGAAGNNNNVNGQNNTGVCGVCWGVKMLPLRIIKKVSTGTYGTYSDAVAAMEYIRQMNASSSRRVAVANHSWGGRGYSLAMLNAINNPTATADPVPSGITASYGNDVDMFLAQGALTEVTKIKTGMTITGPGIPPGTLVVMVSNGCLHLSDHTTQAAASAALSFANPVRPKANGALHVAAAGNSRYNNDRFPTYPASIPSGYVVSVGATDVNDQLAVWAGGAGSNFGLLTVDLFAPGSSIWSTKWKAPGDAGYGYESRNGTSMAAPQVSGAVALLRMWQPALTEMQAKQIVIEQVERLPQLESKCLSRGRLNVAKVLDRLFQPNLQGSGGSTGGNGLSAEALSVGQGLTGQVAKGDNHTLAVRAGKVYAWGGNAVGQIGPAGPVQASYAWPPLAAAAPLGVAGLDDCVMVAACGDSSFSLRQDGSVWAWGGNRTGLLGRGTEDLVPHPVPQQVMGLWDGPVPQPNAVWISAGALFSHVLVANGDGSVWAWGSNDYGELGDFTFLPQSAPVKVLGLTDVIMVAAGREYSMALKRDGTVWEWGRILASSDSFDRRPLPSVVPGLSNIVHIAAGSGTAYAIDENGDVWWWGGFQGLQGNPSYPALSLTPLRYQELSRLVYISSGHGQAVGVDADGRLLSWGKNAVGQLGTGSLEESADPAEINLETTEGVGAIATSGVSCVALLGSGEVVTWGQNDYGELGLGWLDSSNLPVQVRRLENINWISSGAFPHARAQGGGWFSWGFDHLDPEPVAFPFLPGMIEMDGSSAFGFAFGLRSGLMQDGTLRTWGSGNAEYFGSALVPGGIVTIPASAAVQVDGVSNVIDHNISPGATCSINVADISHVTPAGIFGLAAEASGQVKAWGQNSQGQLGDGTTAARTVPVVVTGLTGVAAVAAGGVHGLALKSDGTVWAWGGNTFGQLGDGTKTARTSPVQVSGLSGVTRIEAGLASSLAVKSDGSVWVWGNRAESVLAALSGFLGDQTTPVQVPGLPPVTEARISLGAEPGPSLVDDQQTVLCLGVNGRVYAWSNQPTVLGRFLDTLMPPSTPAPVQGLADVVAIGGGAHCGYAVKTDGTVWTWGRDYYAGLGTGAIQSNLPRRVVGFGGASQTLSTLGTGNEGDSWLLDNFSASELLSDSLVADEGDPDGDGIANLLEYALGLDPRQQSRAGLPSSRVDLVAPQAQSEDATLSQIALFSAPTADLTSGKRYLALTVNRLGGIRQDVDYIIEVSSDLATWHSGDPHTIKVLDTAEVLEAYSSMAIEDAPRQFMRLRVQRREGFFCP